MSEAMSAEFDTIAEWTADLAIELGRDFYIPAACRGSGSPAALDWLIEHLELAPGETLLDSGAGIGGPAAYAAQQRSVRPLLVEPEAGACRAACRLFDHPVVRAAGSALPIADESVDAAWSLGVLCTVGDQAALLSELRRVVRAPGRIGLLVFVAKAPLTGDQPEGNNFPTVDSITTLLTDAGLQIANWHCLAGTVSAAPDWQSREETIDTGLRERHQHKRAWQLAEQQSDAIGQLLKTEKVSGEMLVLRRA